jgi:hypothetical protein
MQKVLEGTHRVSIPASEWQSLVSESCVDQGRPWLRSVDSERGGPRDSAPKGRNEEADAVFCCAEGNTMTMISQSSWLLRGPQSAARPYWGPPGTWELYDFPCGVPRSEAIAQAKRDEVVEVGIAHGTAEAGEPPPVGLGEGTGRSGLQNRRMERCPRHCARETSQRKFNG